MQCMYCRVPLIDAQQYIRALKARKDAPDVKVWVSQRIPTPWTSLRQILSSG